VAPANVTAKRVLTMVTSKAGGFPCCAMHASHTRTETRATQPWRITSGAPTRSVANRATWPISQAVEGHVPYDGRTSRGPQVLRIRKRRASQWNGAAGWKTDPWRRAPEAPGNEHAEGKSGGRAVVRSSNDHGANAPGMLYLGRPTWGEVGENGTSVRGETQMIRRGRMRAGAALLVVPMFLAGCSQLTQMQKGAVIGAAGG